MIESRKRKTAAENAPAFKRLYIDILARWAENNPCPGDNINNTGIADDIRFYKATKKEVYATAEEYKRKLRTSHNPTPDEITQAVKAYFNFLTARRYYTR
jgi:hypothetical protein